jgi:hypothetical protein
MKRFRPRMAGSAFITWAVQPAALPIGWADALRRLETPTPSTATARAAVRQPGGTPASRKENP